MKKYAIVLFSALFVFALATNAQDKPAEKRGKGPTIEERVAKMATDLGLTDEVKASVKTLMEKQDVERKKFMTDNDKESPDFRTKMKEFSKAQGAELKAVIGDEKFKKLQELRAAQRQSEQKPSQKPEQKPE